MILGPGLVLSPASTFFCAARPSMLCLPTRFRPRDRSPGEVAPEENQRLWSRQNKP